MVNCIINNMLLIYKANKIKKVNILHLEHIVVITDGLLNMLK